MANLFTQDFIVSIEDVKDSLLALSELGDDVILGYIRKAELIVKNYIKEINPDMGCMDFTDYLECESEESKKIVLSIQQAELYVIENLHTQAITIAQNEELYVGGKRIKKQTSSCGSSREFEYLKTGCATLCDVMPIDVKGILACLESHGFNIDLCGGCNYCGEDECNSCNSCN